MTVVDAAGGRLGVVTGFRQSQGPPARRATSWGALTQAAVVLWLAYTLTFIAITLLPSNPIDMFAADDTGVIDPQTVEQMKLYYGYDRGVLERYFVELSHVVRGELGYSMSTGQTVTQAIGDAALPTLRLALTAFVIAVLIAGAIVSTATLATRRWLRSSVVALPPLFAAAPVFWVGIVVLNVLSFRLGWISAFPDGTLLSILVPSLVLGLPLSAAMAQVLLKSVDTVLASDFIDVVRAKVPGKHWVFWRHVVRNAAGRGLTVAGTGAGHPGRGHGGHRNRVRPSRHRPRVADGGVTAGRLTRSGFILIIAGVYVVVNLVIDLLYPALDRRILLTSGGPGHDDDAHRSDTSNVRVATESDSAPSALPPHWPHSCCWPLHCGRCSHRGSPVTTRSSVTGASEIPATEPRALVRHRDRAGRDTFARVVHGTRTLCTAP